jgi:hypothetical protein
MKIPSKIRIGDSYYTVKKSRKSFKLEFLLHQRERRAKMDKSKESIYLSTSTSSIIEMDSSWRYFPISASDTKNKHSKSSKRKTSSYKKKK